jgi:hypothetical protein
MCTVSWFFSQNEYQLMCNRDELHTRLPAKAPSIQEKAGVRFIAPIDGDAGGTWIGVNQYGVTLCLLNRYHDPYEPVGLVTSRGQLVMQQLGFSSLSTLRQQMTSLDLAPFKPFTLLALALESSPLLFDWTGRTMLIDEEPSSRIPLVSSSYDQQGVMVFRQQEFQQLLAKSGKIDHDMLKTFHGSHPPAKNAYSTCMHRSDAATVSFSAIRVSPHGISFLYQDGAPCGEGLPESVVKLSFCKESGD